MLSPHVIIVIGSNLSPLLQIAKMTVTHHSRSGTEADSEEVSDSEDEVDDIYEVEILFKTLGQRKRLDVNIRIIQSQEDEELYVYNTVLKVRPSFLKQLIKTLLIL